MPVYASACIEDFGNHGMSQAIPLFISKPGDSIAGFFYAGSDIFVNQKSRTSEKPTSFEEVHS